MESSCDETEVAILKNGREVLANIVSTQIELHKKFGGVVPEVASRKHIENIDAVFQEAIDTENNKWVWPQDTTKDINGGFKSLCSI